MLSVAVLFPFLLPQEAFPDRQPAPKSDVAIQDSSARKADEAAGKGLAFLEKEGVAWTRKNKCSSCHHVPMMLWAQEEAREHGFGINEEGRSIAVAFALKAPFTGFFGPLTREKVAAMSGPSLEMIYLSLGLGGAREPDSTATLAEFRKHLMGKQAPDGSWAYTRKEKGKILAPIEDRDDVITMLGMLALSSGNPSKPEQETLKRSQERALAWLRESASEGVHQSSALGLVIFKKCGDQERVARLTAQLLREQREDGGWSQAKEHPSDALATGQALYALAAAGIDRQHGAIQRGRTFLARTQKDDGSWLVPSRTAANKGKDAIPSYFGSAWAVIGLVQHAIRE